MAQAIQQERGGRRWIGSYVDTLAEIIINTPNLVPADKSSALGSLYAMFKVFNQLAEIYIPVDESGILTLNLNDERYKNVTMGDKQYKVLPVIPARTLLTSLLHSTAQTKQNFDEQNQIQRAPHSSSTSADSEL